jgi:hypothetical protein
MFENSGLEVNGTGIVSCLTVDFVVSGVELPVPQSRVIYK